MTKSDKKLILSVLLGVLFFLLLGYAGTYDKEQQKLDEEIKLELMEDTL